MENKNYEIWKNNKINKSIEKRKYKFVQCVKKYNWCINEVKDDFFFDYDNLSNYLSNKNLINFLKNIGGIFYNVKLSEQNISLIDNFIIEESKKLNINVNEIC